MPIIAFHAFFLPSSARFPSFFSQLYRNNLKYIFPVQQLVFKKHQALFKTYWNWQDAPMIYLSHISAFLFWRSFDGANFRVEPLAIINGNPENRKRQRDRIVSFAQANGFVDANGKVHITTLNGAVATRSSAIAAHTTESDIAASCLLIDGEIAVSSPELTFVQMSSLLEST